jgi:hypothetical protein
LIETIRLDLANFADIFEVEVRFSRFDTLNEARLSKNFRPFRTLIFPKHVGGNSGGTTGLGNIRGSSLAGAYDYPERWDTEKEDIARSECIRAFFEDLKEICATRPVVMMLDSWERSSSELQEWIVNRVVRPLCFDIENRSEMFGLVLAGRELPDFEQLIGDEARYSKLVISIESLGAWEEDHVKAFLQAHGYGAVSAEEDLVRVIHSRLRSGLSLDSALQFAEAARDAGTS